MSISMIGNQYQMSAVVYGVSIDVRASTLDGVKEAFEYQLFLLELSQYMEQEA